MSNIDLSSLPAVIQRILTVRCKPLNVLYENSNLLKERFHERLDRMTAVVQHESQRLLEPRKKKKFGEDAKALFRTPIPPRIVVPPRDGGVDADDGRDQKEQEPSLMVQITELSREQLIERYEAMIRVDEKADKKLVFWPGDNINVNKLDARLPPGSRIVQWIRLMSWNVHRLANAHNQAKVVEYTAVLKEMHAAILACQEAPAATVYDGGGPDDGYTTQVRDGDDGGKPGLERRAFAATHSGKYGNRLDTVDLRLPRVVKLPPCQILELGDSRRAQVQVYEIYQNNATRDDQMLRLVVCNVHLDVSDGTGKRGWKEIGKLIDYLRSPPHQSMRDWFIVMGDFNDVDERTADPKVWTAWEKYHRDRNRWDERRKYSACKLLRTCRLHFVHVSELDVSKISRPPLETVWSGWPVDYIFVHVPEVDVLKEGPDPLTLQIGSSGRRLVNVSDHLPVWVDVALVELPRQMPVQLPLLQPPQPQPQQQQQQQQQQQNAQQIHDQQVRAARSAMENLAPGSNMPDFYRVLYMLGAVGVRQEKKHNSGGGGGGGGGGEEKVAVENLLRSDEKNWVYQLIAPDQHWFWHRERLTALLTDCRLQDAWTPENFIQNWQQQSETEETVVELVRRIASCIPPDITTLRALQTNNLILAEDNDDVQQQQGGGGSSSTRALKQFQLSTDGLAKEVAWNIIATSTSWEVARTRLVQEQQRGLVNGEAEEEEEEEAEDEAEENLL